MTKESFVLTSKLHPPKSPNLFIGPFADKDSAQDYIDTAKQDNYDLYTGEETPKTHETGIYYEIMTWSAARRKGMTSPALGDEDDKNNLFSTLEEAYGQTDNEIEKITEESTELPELGEEEEMREPIQEMNNIQTEEPKRKRGRPPKAEQTSKPTPNGTKKSIPTPTPAPKKQKPLADLDPENTIIVTDNQGYVEWLAEKGIRGQLLTRVNHPSQIEGKTVIGVLPIWLETHVEKIGIINMPGLQPDQRMKNYLSPAEMNKAGARIDWYGPAPFMGSS